MKYVITIYARKGGPVHGILTTGWGAQAEHIANIYERDGYHVTIGIE